MWIWKTLKYQSKLMNMSTNTISDMSMELVRLKLLEILRTLCEQKRVKGHLRESLKKKKKTKLKNRKRYFKILKNLNKSKRLFH